LRFFGILNDSLAQSSKERNKPTQQEEEKRRKECNKYRHPPIPPLKFSKPNSWKNRRLRMERTAKERRERERWGGGRWVDVSGGRG